MNSETTIVKVCHGSYVQRNHS